MIGRLVGSLVQKSTHGLLLDVNGVGYEIEVPLSTAFALPDEGASLSLFTHFVVREDAQLLYGFINQSDRDMFRVLIKVNGVGPKLGVAILSGLDSSALARCVQEDDVSTLVKLPGIGKKTAERLLIELRDKVKSVDVLSRDDMVQAPEAPNERAISDEAESALIALGYRPQDAAKAVKKAMSQGLGLEETIKSALKSML